MTNAEIISAIKMMPVMELVDMVDAIREEFGIVEHLLDTPFINLDPVVPIEEVQEEFAVRLMVIGEAKINVIKTIRSLLSEVGLREAKELVESAPVTVAEGVSRDEANRIKTVLEEAGATIQIQ